MGELLLDLWSRDRKAVMFVTHDLDEAEKLARFAEAESLTFPLASDEDHAVSEAWGAWGEKKNYGKTYMGVQRSAFLIDESGKVVYTEQVPEIGQEPDYDQALQAIQ